MIGKITDEKSMQDIVSCGIIPAIGKAMQSDTTVDQKVQMIGRLVNCYNSFYLTGREVKVRENEDET